jgi:hypothetical protein
MILRPKRKLVLNKGRETYIFWYAPGDESALLDAVIDLAQNGRTGFDWFDAALIGFKALPSLIFEAEHLFDD